MARREEKVAEMYEAARAARRTRLQDAKRGLEKLRKSAEAPTRAASVMKLQLAPVAAPESFEAIAVDWVAPPKADAAYFHLQWRRARHRQRAKFEGVGGDHGAVLPRAGCAPT